MPQLTIYLDQQTDRLVRDAAGLAGEPASKWVADAIRHRIGREWPLDVLAIWEVGQQTSRSLTFYVRVLARTLPGKRSDVGRSRIDLVLDANALIHALKGVGRVRERLTATDPGRIAIPAVAFYEIEYGTLRSANPGARRRDLNRVLSVMEILPFDGRAAERAASVRFDLEKRGETIGPHDLMIAGTALASGCRLVTNNVSEFSRVSGLEIEDWY